MSINQVLWKRNCKIEVSNDLGTITIENLHTTFHADINMETNENKADVTIYNLNRDHREFVVRKGGKVRVFVSYGMIPNYGLLFHADLLKSSNALMDETNKTKSPHQKHNTEWETTIELGDAAVAAKKLLKKSYKGKVSTTTIIKDALKEMPDVTAPSNLDSIASQVFNNGITISETAMDVVHKMLAKVGGKAVTHKKKMAIIFPGSASARKIKEISAETGLLEAPIKTDKGIEFAILIDPDLQVGDNVYVKSPSLGNSSNQVWLVTKILVHGSLRENAWEMRCNAVINKGERVV